MSKKIKNQKDASISELVKELGTSDFLTRQRARLLLVHHAPESISELEKALKSQNTHTRWEAVQALGDIRAAETAPVLANMLMDEDTSVRWAAMESLIRIGRASLHPLLERFVKDFSSIWMREGLHHILRVLKDRHELKPLEIALFEKLDEQVIPGFENGWTSEQAWAAERALEALDRERIFSRKP